MATNISSSYESTLLRLDTLENEYRLLLLEYQQIYNNYVSLVMNANGDTQINTIIPKSEMVGSSANIETISESTVELCQAQCSSNTSCSGATYNSNTQSCTLKTGNLTVIKSSDSNNYAIVTELSQLTTLLITMNNRLAEIFKQINQTVKELIPSNEQEQLIKNETSQRLIIEYQNLLNEQKQLLALESQNNKITQDYDRTELSLNQINLSYIVWFLLAIGVIIFAIKVFYMY
jgi:hypothetical protein